MRVVRGASYTLCLGRMEDALGVIGGFDHILTDPPYRYLKGQAFDRGFDEALLFETARRVMPDRGFIALFGRGSSFYRWNTMLAGLGFVFKEELVWDKRRTTAPCMALSRTHETISLHTRKTGKIRRARAPYKEMRQFDLESISRDIERLKSAAQTSAGLDKIAAYLRTGKVTYDEERRGNIRRVTLQDGTKAADPAVQTLNAIEAGMKEKTIMRVSTVRYGAAHPAEKPVRLAERILALISDRGDAVCDPFMGSGAIGEACVRTGRRYIGCEIDGGYFDAALKRLREAEAQPCLGFD